MSIIEEVHTPDWRGIDTWWESYSKGREPAIDGHSLIRKIERDWGADDFQEMDRWWKSYLKEREPAIDEHSLARNLESNWSVEAAKEVDDWWESYAEVLQEDLTEFQDVIERINREWDESNSIFGEDPLTGRWEDRSGPLRSSHEENWSHWLAHLVRSSSGEFVEELLGDDYGRQSKNVRREVYFGDEELHDRRADIIIEFRTHGVSIEVKIGDENYGKTNQTARLVEKNDPRRNWTHILLLPEYKRSRLKMKFGDDLVGVEKEGRPTILSDEYPDVDVVYWKDVSQAIRRTLLHHGEESNEKWEASAYTLVNLIERNICSFSTLEESQDSVDLTGIHGVRSASQEQLRHLRSLLEVKDNE